MSTKKLSTEEFIRRAKLIHEDKFSYEDAMYVNMSKKVEVKCNSCLHTWLVTPGNHIGPKKSGCPECKKIAHIERNQINTKTTEQFISEAKISNPKLDYSKTVYRNCKTKVTVTCPVHGDVQKWPSDILAGGGCPKCAGRDKTTKEFVTAAKALFPQFDYSKVVYKGAKSKVIIICPTHGEFLQTPNSILNNNGCKECTVSRVLATRINNGTIRHPNQVPALERYRRAVWRFSYRSFKLHAEKVNPNNYVRSRDGYHLDHIFPIQQGFHNNVDPEIIGHWTNLQMLPAKANQSKSNSLHGITLEQLFEKYETHVNK